MDFTVAANTATTARAGTITVAGQTFTINQAAPCSFSISPTGQTIPAAGADGTVSVSATAGCAWSATSNAAWITITSGANGNGDGAVTYTVPANESIVARSGTMTVAGQTFTITQPPLWFTAFGQILVAKGTQLTKITLVFALVSGSGPVPAPVQTVSNSNGNWTQTGFQVGATYSVTPVYSRYTFTPRSLTFTNGSLPLNFTATR